MAHLLENMFYVGQTPWHGLGVSVQDAPSVAEAIKLAGLDWAVRKESIYLGTNATPIGTTVSAAEFSAQEYADHRLMTGRPVDAPIAQRDGQEITSHKALIRATDGACLGVVGNRYTPLQNSEAFSFFDPLVQSGLVELETAGSLAGGRRIWILARIKGEDITIVGKDTVRRYVLLSNSHDGTTSVRAGFSPVRVVCANTLSMSQNSSASSLIRLRHSHDVAKNLESVREILNLANKTFEATAEKYRFLASKTINAADLRKYVKIVLGHEATEDKDLSARASNQIDNVVRMATFGRGQQLDGVGGTLWAAYNGVTEFLTHEASKDADKRYNALWFGQNAVRSATALNLALDMAKTA